MVSEWDAECIECGTSGPEEDFESCMDCAVDLCSDCARYCEDCGSALCSTCAHADRDGADFCEGCHVEVAENEDD